MSAGNHSMEAFKLFVRKHPSLVKEVRRGIYTWQEIYEDWYLLGEENPVWEGYRGEGIVTEERESKGNKEEMEKAASLFESLKNMDVQAMQRHVSTLSNALGTISGVISQFQGSGTEEKKPEKKQQNPFMDRKD